MFVSDIILMPFPADPELTVLQARELQALVAQTDLAAVKQTALNDILSADNKTAPSETERLRDLYRQVYSTAELEGLIERTFARLGLSE